MAHIDNFLNRQQQQRPELAIVYIELLFLSDIHQVRQIVLVQEIDKECLDIVANSFRCVKIVHIYLDTEAVEMVV